ncbi:MAG TPA: hypothetical protein DHV28_12695 [Ignavibacteriales bacterium]|nr:hypothetical protein [Ignavibacteriales bacterium]
MIKKLFFLLFFLTVAFISLSTVSCSNNSNKEITRGVYFWKTNFSLSTSELNWLKETEIKKLYVRFFDVDWNPNINSAVPVGEVSISTKKIVGVEIIPVVFITNRTLLNLPDTLIAELSNNIYKKIFAKLSLFENQPIKEIQLDCDWTETTRERYFELINQIKKLSSEKNIEITATIRLHQVKFFSKTGVPPIKRGMLMFYNMSDVSDIRTKNSIYDKDIAKRYLVNFDKYPIALDVVLPAFSWSCWFRNGKLKNLINDVKTKDLEANLNFVKEDKNIFRATKESYLKGNYILTGDYLRTEETDFNTTLEAAELIAPHIKNKKINVSIYHLNGEVIKNYDKDNFEAIVDCFN